MTKKTALSLIIMFLLASGICFAESLWTSSGAASMYRDPKASKVGDLITILIVETTSSSQNASTDAKKSTTIDIKQGIGSFFKRIPFFNNLPLGYDNSNTFKANGSTARANNLIGKMTVKVTKVDPNGNLIVEGTRRISTNAESAYLKLTGTVRPQDIEQDNSLLSTYLGDANISYEGKGPIGTRQKEGLISKIINILF